MWILNVNNIHRLSDSLILFSRVFVMGNENIFMFWLYSYFHICLICDWALSSKPKKLFHSSTDNPSKLCSYVLCVGYTTTIWNLNRFDWYCWHAKMWGIKNISINIIVLPPKPTASAKPLLQRICLPPIWYMPRMNEHHMNKIVVKVLVAIISVYLVFASMRF